MLHPREGSVCKAMRIVCALTALVFWRCEATIGANAAPPAFFHWLTYKHANFEWQSLLPLTEIRLQLRCCVIVVQNVGPISPVDPHLRAAPRQSFVWPAAPSAL